MNLSEHSWLKEMSVNKLALNGKHAIALKDTIQLHLLELKLCIPNVRQKLLSPYLSPGIIPF